MLKRSRKAQKKKRAQDENESAFDAIRRILELTEGTEGKNPPSGCPGALGRAQRRQGEGRKDDTEAETEKRYKGR